VRFFEDEQTQFELAIVGYQFPHVDNAQYDSNWLNITIRVTHPYGSWSATDPSLLTYEVERFAQWLDAMAQGHAVDAAVGFIEPNLSFVLVERNSVKKVRVYFELESRPAWAAANSAGREDLWVEFTVTVEMLRSAAYSLRSQLQQFPVRAWGDDETHRVRKKRNHVIG
jgi:hypothetical protein